MSFSTKVRLERYATDEPWGFRLQGGSDYSIPLSIQLVNPNTLAHASGLNAGDQVISINNRNVTNVSHQEAKMEIIRSGNELELTVIKRAINQLPIQTPQLISQARIDPVHQRSTSQTVKNNIVVSRQPQTHIGSSHNREVMSFDAEVNNEMTYHAAKPTNWQPGDYTQDVPEHLHLKVFHSVEREARRPKAYPDNPQAPARNVGTAVYHAQYNSPIGLYSDDKVLEAFKTQAGSLIDEITGNSSYQSSANYDNNIHNQPSPTYQAIMNCQQQH